MSFLTQLYKKASLLLFLGMLIASSLSAASETKPSENQFDSWRFTTGLGVYAFPEYDGSTEHRTLMIPMFEVTYKERFYFSLLDGIGAEMIKTKNFTLKGSINFEFGREEDDDKNLNGIGDISDSVTASLLADYRIGRFNPYVNLQKHLGGTEGVQAEFGLKTFFQFGTSVNSSQVIIDLSSEYSNEKHMVAFFGINETQSANSRLLIYAPKAGISAYKTSVTYFHPLTERWAATATVNFTKFTGDAADSVLTFDDNQLSTGFFVLYAF